MFRRFFIPFRALFGYNDNTKPDCETDEHKAMVQVVKSAPQNPHDKKKRKTEEVLEGLEAVSKEQEAARLAARLGLPYFDLHIFPVTQDAITTVTEQEAREYKIAVFERKGDNIKVAFANPEDQTAADFIAALAEERELQIEPYVVSLSSLEKAWRVYREAPILQELNLMRVSLSGEELQRFEEDFGALMQLKSAKKVSISQTIEIILAGANKFRASDIHIEPEKESVRLRYRVDGVLQDIGTISPDIYKLTLSRVKMLAHMKINIRDRAQDGHFGIDLEEKHVDLRVNIIPGSHGESINMRILNAEDVLYDVQRLGAEGSTYEKIRVATEKPYGMVVNTGPTGSGKTTTLYSILNEINGPDRKIITVEDPIEYQIPGIVQTEVKKDGDYSFATALRAIVRQDPDVILVGEIRDEDTAEVAMNASMTGHLVLSTVHANTAPGAIPRFLELGLKPSVLASSINVIIGQRLVRTLCPHCKESYKPAEETMESIKEILSIISPKAKLDIPKNSDTLWNPKGCAECKFTGYQGRIGIFEAFTITKDIEQIILDLGTEAELTRAAIEDGMVTMVQDGILKALRGITSLEEIWRVTGQKETLLEVYAELMPSMLSRTSLLSKETLSTTRQHLDTLDNFSKYITTLDGSELLRSVFAAALLLDAGDIHFEPTENEVTVRLRIDGILQTAGTFSKSEYPQILGEMKLWSGMKSGERAGVADGRFSLDIREVFENIPARQVDFRLSIILGGFGETAVIRVLQNATCELSLSALGFREENLKRIESSMKRANGIIINTGPTGSGKTTTLYSILSQLNRPETKIITVEDPIEYRLPGILQTQVNDQEGYGFASALRSLLRQNPDILMIGEIRDEETAKIALQASETGHLVLSTIHANSAAGVISRFTGMGAEPEGLANAIAAIIAQRLVRKLCIHCRKKETPTEEEASMIDRIVAMLPDSFRTQLPKERFVYRAAGCKHCNGTGYDGQTVLSEVLTITPEIEALINTGALTSEIEKAAIEGGMITLVGDGILAVLDGTTSLDEVRRVTNE